MNIDYPIFLKELLETTIRQQASDLHISPNHNPIVRISGRLIPLIKLKSVSPEESIALAKLMMGDDRFEAFLATKEMDFSYDHEGKARFRVNVYYQKGAVASALRLIPKNITGIDGLNLPTILHDFAKASQGFVIITGPSSHGKSTTLAALIDEINHTRADHVITIEDPIEYIFTDDKCIIDQREVGQDTNSFSLALKATFRQDPDVIMVGEMRDPDTISTAITAAETGHLVFATLHTNSASQTIHRIVDSFPPEQQNQVRVQLASSLLGIVSQRLVPRTKGGLIPACEVMLNNPAVSNLIRENKVHELDLVIETSAETGMISLNRSLSNLVRLREISLVSALSYSLSPNELRRLFK